MRTFIKILFIILFFIALTLPLPFGLLLGGVKEWWWGFILTFFVGLFTIFAIDFEYTTPDIW